MMNINKRPVMAKEKFGSELLWRQEDDKHILLARHDMYILNAFSREILDLCDGTRTVKDIIDYVVSKYSVTDDEATNQLSNFFNYTMEKQLLTLED